MIVNWEVATYTSASCIYTTPGGASGCQSTFKDNDPTFNNETNPESQLVSSGSQKRAVF